MDGRNMSSNDKQETTGINWQHIQKLYPYLCAEAPLDLHDPTYVNSVGHDISHDEVALRLEPGLPNLSYLHINVFRGRRESVGVRIGLEQALDDDEFLLSVVIPENILETK